MTDPAIIAALERAREVLKEAHQRTEFTVNYTANVSAGGSFAEDVQFLQGIRDAGEKIDTALAKLCAEVPQGNTITLHNEPQPAETVTLRWEQPYPNSQLYRLYAGSLFAGQIVEYGIINQWHASHANGQGAFHPSLEAAKAALLAAVRDV